jgi:hypothetical protein
MFRGVVLLAALITLGTIGAGPASPAGGTLVGSVGPTFVISLTLDGAPVTVVPPGDYTLTVTDNAANHNFHIFGPGLDQVVTTVPFVGTVTTTIHLTHGTYTFQCDPHQAIMNGTFSVPDRAPAASDDRASATSGGTTVIPVLANDADADGDALTPSIASAPARGTATVNADGTVTYSAPATFAGTDTFTYSVSDGSLTSATATVTVAVEDATPPVLTLPAPITANANRPRGARVSFAATATDTVDPSPAVSCSPTSRSRFGVGTTIVECTATDAAGNVARGSFPVYVQGAAEQLGNLAAAVGGVGVGNRLAVRVGEAQWRLAHGRVTATCITLDVFAIETRLEQLLFRKIAGAQANALIADARRIENALGC